mgnify:CR=1 FL=1
MGWTVAALRPFIAALNAPIERCNMSEIEIVYPNFEGKCISLSMINSEESNNIDIFNPTFENQAGRIFIKGTSPKGSTESGWVEGCEVAVAWERVSDYFVFESSEEFEKAAEKSRLFYENQESQ